MARDFISNSNVLGNTIKTTTVSTHDDVEKTVNRAFERYHNQVFRWALRYGAGDAETAKDITQDVFVKFCETATREPIANVGGWLYTAAANLAITNGKHRKSWASRLLTYFNGDVETVPSAERKYILQESAENALRLLDELPTTERVVAMMALVDEVPQKDIAAALKLSESRISRLLSRAKDRLNKRGSR